MFLNDERRYKDEEDYHMEKADEMNKTGIGLAASWIAYAAARVARDKKNAAWLNQDRMSEKINTSTREADMMQIEPLVIDIIIK